MPTWAKMARINTNAAFMPSACSRRSMAGRACWRMPINPAESGFVRISHCGSVWRLTGQMPDPWRRLSRVFPPLSHPPARSTRHQCHGRCRSQRRHQARLSQAAPLRVRPLQRIMTTPRTTQAVWINQNRNGSSSRETSEIRNARREPKFRIVQKRNRKPHRDPMPRPVDTINATNAAWLTSRWSFILRASRVLAHLSPSRGDTFLPQLEHLRRAWRQPHKVCTRNACNLPKRGPVTFRIRLAVTTALVKRHHRMQYAT